MDDFARKVLDVHQQHAVEESEASGVGSYWPLKGGSVVFEQLCLGIERSLWKEIEWTESQAKSSD